MAARKKASSNNTSAEYLDSHPVLMGYLARIGAELRNFRVAVVKQEFGSYYSEVAIIKISPKGEIASEKEEFLPTEPEVEALKKEFTGTEFPHSIPIRSLDSAPDDIRGAGKKDVFIFYNARGEIVFVQKRIVDKEGERHFLPYSYWSDRQWRRMEPDGKLPIWGAEQLASNTTVFIHEGAKSARFVRTLVEGETPEARLACAEHPWGQELKGGAHIGWIGGALAPLRTDWSQLERVKVNRIIFICDNDLEGKEAVAKVAKQLSIRIMAVKFDKRFKPGFDLADPFPEEMFREINGVQVYRGPSMEECMTPATWATEAIPNPTGKGRPSYRIRREFLEQWHYSAKPPVFVHVDTPHKTYNEAEFNIVTAPYSDVANTAQLLRKHPAAEAQGICYEPGLPSGVLNFGGSAMINTHVASGIGPREGSAKPWLDFMEHLIPNAEDRKNVLQWCATLIHCRDRRPQFGVLLISEVQGVGKTTLAEKIMAPLVGWENVSVPSEREVVESQFNSWLARVRLVMIHEIYAGQSKKAYNEIKSIITERKIRVNEKFQPTYEIANWSAFLAASNSRRALHMEYNDRRWLVPEVTEKKKPLSYWNEFNSWLGGFGLNIIRRWAGEFIDDVGALGAGETAPDSATKKNLVDDSLSDGQRIVTDLGLRVRELEGKSLLNTAISGDKLHNGTDQRIILIDSDVQDWLAEQLGVEKNFRFLESLSTIRSTLRKIGFVDSETRVKLEGRGRKMALNFIIEPDQLTPLFVRKHRVDPRKIMRDVEGDKAPKSMLMDL